MYVYMQMCVYSCIHMHIYIYTSRPARQVGEECWVSTQVCEWVGGWVGGRASGQVGNVDAAEAPADAPDAYRSLRIIKTPVCKSPTIG